MMRKLTFYTFIFLLVISKSYGTKHRTPEDEGWAWASSFKYCYRYDEGAVELNFQQIHEMMKNQESTVRSTFLKNKDDLSNICIARFSFVIEKEDKTEKPKLININSDPIQNHVFISGGNVPDSNYIKMQGKIYSSDPRNLYAIKHSLESYKHVVFIHPLNYFSETHLVINRLNNRYLDVTEEKIKPLIMPKLAKEWARINSNHPASPMEFIEWYNSANGQSIRCPSKDKKQVDKGVFYTQNEDSEQKLLYYLNGITSCVKEVKFFKTLLGELRDCIHKSPVFIASEIKKMASLIKSEESKYRASIDTFIKNMQEYEEHLHSLEADILNLISRLEFIKDNNLIDSTYHCDVVLEYAKDALDIIRTLALEDIETIAEKKKKLEEISNSNHLYVDPLIDNFEKVVKGYLQINQGYFISAIILNIHNTYDGCYSCAPDLAQESIRKNGFVEYLKNTIERHNPNLHKPFFRMVVSCGKIRKDKWCDGCVNKSNDNVTPLLSPPISGSIKYYQHLFDQADPHNKGARGVIGIRGDVGDSTA